MKILNLLHKYQEIAPIDVQVTAQSGLWIRKEANENSEKIRLLSLGENILSVKRGINSNWHEVITKDGKIGYMSGDYLKQISDITNCNYTAKVKTNDGDGCNVRIGPSTSVDTENSIPDGTQVTVINTGTYNLDGYSWDRVILNNGSQGFIANKFLR